MPEQTVLAALQSLAGEDSALAEKDWQAIAAEALRGSAPAQYIVATGFEKLGDITQALAWYEKSAIQRYSPARAKLKKLKADPAA